eukprot:g1445.t1
MHASKRSDATGLTLAELAYNSNHQMHVFKERKGDAGNIPDYQQNNENVSADMKMKMETADIGFEIQNVVVPIIEIFTKIDLENCHHVEVNDLVLAINHDPLLLNVFGEKAVKKIVSDIQVYAPPLRQIGEDFSARIISKEQLLDIIINRLPATVKLIQNNMKLSAPASIYHDIVRKKLMADKASASFKNTKPNIELGEVLLKQSKRIQKRRGSAIGQTPETLRKLEESSVSLQSSQHRDKTVVFENAIAIIREIDALHMHRKNLDEDRTLLNEEKSERDSRLCEEITNLEKELEQMIQRVPEIGETIADWRLRHNRLMARQTRYLSVSHHAQVSKNLHSKMIDTINSGELSLPMNKLNQRLDEQFRRSSWDDRALLGGISRQQNEYDNFVKTRRRASCSNRIRLKKSELLDLQSHRDRNQLHIHKNFDLLTRSQSASNRNQMYNEKKNSRIYNEEGYNDGRSRRRSMAIALSNDVQVGKSPSTQIEKVTKKANNYRFERPRPTLRNKAVWTPSARHSEKNDWYVPGQMVRNLTSDMISPNEASKDAAAQRYLSRVMQKNKDVAQYTFFQQEEEFDLGASQHSSYSDLVDHDFY